MTPPPWVAGALAAVLLAIAGYCATRLVAARWWQRSTDHAVDVMHTVMGVAMAGILVPRLNLVQARAWAALFAAGAVWFGRQARRDRRRHHAGNPALRGGRVLPGGRAQTGGPALGGHHGAHSLSCAAMVCMLLAAPHLGAPIAAGSGAVPVVALVLAVAVAISVVVSTDRISALQRATVPVTPAQGAAGPALAPSGSLPSGSHPAGSTRAATSRRAPCQLAPSLSAPSPTLFRRAPFRAVPRLLAPPQPAASRCSAPGWPRPARS